MALQYLSTIWLRIFQHKSICQLILNHGKEVAPVYLSLLVHLFSTTAQDQAAAFKASFLKTEQEG